MAVQTAVNFCGIHLKNPFLMASTPATRAHKWPLIAKAGWAGAVTWGVERAKTVPRPRIYSPSKFIDREDPEQTWCCQLAMGRAPAIMEEGEVISDHNVLTRRIGMARKSGIVVCANILEQGEVEPWVSTCRVAEAAGADIIELNFSCPVPLFGLYFSRDLPLIGAIVKAVKRATRIPIMAKLHMWLLPEEIKAQARTVVEAGADAISVSNILTGIVGIDIDTGLPWARDIDRQGVLRSTTSPFSGPVVKPMALRAIAEVASVVDVPISGAGGVTSWRTAVEYMMAGATTLQVGVGAMLFGYDMVKDLVTGLTAFMEQKGYEQVNDFIGLTRRKVAGFGEPRVPTAIDLKRHMLIDTKLCDGCGRCVRSCQATADGAMKMAKRVAYIQQEKCIQCNACKLVCPRNAIKSVSD